jgi:hypothetical protein
MQKIPKFSKAFFSIIVGWTILINDGVAEEWRCIGEEKAINSMTGVERVIPIDYHITISKNTATIQGLDNVIFSVKEKNENLILFATIGKTRLMGEFTIKISKKNGEFKGKSWLFSRANIDSKKGKCEKMEEVGNDKIDQ